jgi:hypothetical protein
VKRQRIGHSVALASIVAVVGGFAPAVAQDATATGAAPQSGAAGGTTLTFGVSSKLSINDNYKLAVIAPGTSTILDTTLSFGYLTETATDRFAFDIDGVLRASDIPGVGSDFRFDDSTAALSYSREGANSRFSATADYNRVNLDFLDPFSLANLSDTDLINSSGRLASRNANLTFETGINGPLGFGIELGHQGSDYSNTTDPGLFDNTTDDIALTSRLRLSPVAEARARLSQENYRAEDVGNTDRTTRALSFGLAYEISPITTLDASVGTETIDTVGSAKTRGTFGTISLTRALANGSAGLILDRSFGIEGGRTTLTAKRSMDLPTGTLAYSLGVTRGELGGTAVVGSIAYSQTLPRGDLTASLDRTVESNKSGNDILTTNAALGYTMALTPVSGLSLDFNYAAVENVGVGTAADTKRSALRAQYTHELTADWNLSAGYEHQRLVTAGSGTADSNTVFMTLGREFSIRR